MKGKGKGAKEYQIESPHGISGKIRASPEYLEKHGKKIKKAGKESYELGVIVSGYGDSVKAVPTSVRESDKEKGKYTSKEIKELEQRIQSVETKVNNVPRTLQDFQRELFRRLDQYSRPEAKAPEKHKASTPVKTTKRTPTPAAAQSAEPQKNAALETILNRYCLPKEQFDGEDGVNSFEYSTRLQRSERELRNALSTDQLAELIRYARTKKDPREYVSVISAYLKNRETGEEVEDGNLLPVKLKEAELFAVGGDVWYFKGKPHSPVSPDNNADFFRNLWKEQGFLEQSQTQPLS